MADVFTNDLRIREQEVGANSGSWGGYLNTSLENIAEAFSYGTEALADSAAQTLTLADGASDELRSLYLKLTGTLSQATTVTLAPNTISKCWIIENATSGGYDVTISQGSGANVTVGNGNVKMIATDGAGAGAVVYDLLTDLALAGNVSITSSDNTSQLTLTSTDDDASVGPRFDLRRDSSSPAADDHLGAIRWMGEDSAGNALSYAHAMTYIEDPTDGAEDGKFEIDTRVAGTMRSRLLMHSTSTIFNQESLDVDFRIESNNISSMFFIDAGNDRVGIGTDTPAEMLELEDSVDGEVAVKVTNDSTGSSAYSSLFLQGQGSNFKIKNWGDGTSNANATEFVSTAGSSAFFFAPGSSEKVRISNSGELAVGTSSPDSLVHMAGSGGTAVLTMENPDTGLSTNETIGQINFETQDSGGAGVNAYIKAAGANTSGAAYLAFGTGTGNSPSERLRMDNAGHMGFNTSSIQTFTNYTSYHFAPAGTTSTALLIDDENGASGRFQIFMAGSGYIGTRSSDALIVTTDDSERMRIGATGNVTIGRTDTSNAATDHGHNIYSNGKYYQYADGSGNTDVWRMYDSSGTLKAALDADGDWHDHSDERAKESIVDAPSVLEKISNIKVRSFSWKSDGRKREYGFVAQELNEVAPETVSSPKEDADFWGVKTTRLVPMLTKAIQEQQTLIETLEAKVKTLEEA